MRRAARTDNNSAEIVMFYRSVGAQVLVLGGTLDLLVLFRQKVYLVDCKSKDGRLTRRQRELVDSGWPVHFPRSVEEALAVIGLTLHGYHRTGDDNAQS